MNLPTVLIADDHKVVADGLVRLLDEQFDIVDTIHDGHRVLEAVSRLRPDVILLDISMPGLSGLEAMRQFSKHGIESKTIVLTMHADANLAVESLRAGARGFVLKESSGEELLTALTTVLTGGTYLASGLTKEILTLMVGAGGDNARLALSAQQRDVLRLIVRGHRAKEIGATLDISTRSVEATKYRMMQLFDVHSTAELVRYAIENRLITL
jgi:DNA-binding NarL/FixJ family response regulator